MNILPKKSWHVLSRKNIQRVREDEAADKRADEEKLRRATLAEQEAKIKFMRKRQRALEGEEDDDQGAEGKDKQKEGKDKQKDGKKEVKIITPDGHINFFADLQTGVGADKANPEHVAEKKAEQEKFEKKIGLLTYLVDKDSSSSDPWYTKSSTHEQSILQGKRKAAADPLNDMMMYVKEKKKSADEAQTQPVSSKSSSLASSSSHKKHRHKHKDSKKKNLDKLREERRRREEAEKAKSESLLKKHYGLEPDPVAVQEQPQRYNSQFNPHLARVRR